jgi:hypothetical protein
VAEAAPIVATLLIMIKIAATLAGSRSQNLELWEKRGISFAISVATIIVLRTPVVPYMDQGIIL